MKKSLIVGGVLVTGALIGPKLISQSTESAFAEEVAKLNNIPGYVVKVTNYQAGWFSSTAQVSLGFDVDYMTPAANQTINDETFYKALAQGIAFDVAIQHGPIIVSPNMQLSLSSSQWTFADGQSLVEQAKAALNVPELLTANANTTLLGSRDINITVPALKFSNPLMNISFAGLQLDIESPLSGGEYQFTGSFGAVNAEGMMGQLESSAIALSGSGKQLADMIDTNPLMYGYGDLVMDWPLLKVNSMESFELKGIKLETSVDKDEQDKVFFLSKMGFAEFSGTPLPTKLTDVHYDISLRNMDESVLKSFHNISQDFNTTEWQSPETMEKFKVLGKQFLAGEPVLSLDRVAFKLDDATFDVNASANLDKAFIDQLDFSSPQGFLQALVVNLNGKFSKDILTKLLVTKAQMDGKSAGMTQEQIANLVAQHEQQSQAMLQQFIQMGYLKQTDDSLEIVGLFKEGTMTVNGTPVPLPM